MQNFILKMSKADLMLVLNEVLQKVVDNIDI